MKLIQTLFIILSVSIISGEIIEETGSLKEFLSGTQEGIAYDNFISHISEGIVDTGYNDYGPTWLDNQTNGFGEYTIIPQESSILTVWEEVMDHFLMEEYVQVDAILTDSLDTFQYDLVMFQDSVLSRTYYMLRERLDTTFVDNNETGIPDDDVVGSFQNGWGLYILNPEALNRNMVVQVPHPCDDFLSSYIGMEIFLQCDAFAYQIAGAGREVVWTEEGDYNNDRSLSDPSRNENSLFHLFHKAVTDSLENNPPHSPVVLQMHSFDNESHDNILRSIVLSGGYDAGNANKPIRDVTDSHLDFVHFTEEYPIPAEMYGDHPELHITYYYQVHYNGSFFFEGDSGSYSIPHTYELLGTNTNRQLLDLHNGFNHGGVYEPFVHIEFDEKPLLFDALDLPMEELLFQGMLPVTWRNYENFLLYYQPFVDAVNGYFNNWATVPDTTAPLEVPSLTLSNTSSYYVDLSWNHVEDTNFQTYSIYYDTIPELVDPLVWNLDQDWDLLNMYHSDTRITGLAPETNYYFKIGSEDHFSNLSDMSETIMAMTIDPVVLINFDTVQDSLGSWDDQDEDSLSWEFSDSITYGQSPYALYLYGNTWKTMEISPFQVSDGHVWQVAVFSDGDSEIQAFGVGDSINTLFYCFAGSQELNIEEWVTVYQGNFPDDQWNLYQLPIADDWFAWYDYYPLIDTLIFINDDDWGEPGEVFFDYLVDLTDVLPVPPAVSIEYDVGSIYRSNGVRQVDIQFYSDVVDPDTYSHDYFWSFGDDSSSVEEEPIHTFLVEDDHAYTVFLEVTDQTERVGRATVQIDVDDGETSFPLTMNFVGDIILARYYESEGGIIPTLGVEAIFEPTLSILGENADITVANLEAPLTTAETRHPTKPIVFKGSPENVSGLVFAGIDIVTLANNHVMDYMLPGIHETQLLLSQNNILHSGAGANSLEAYQPVFLQKKGVNIAFLASSDRTGQYNNYQPYLNAGFNKPGFAYMTPYYLLQQIETVQDVADLIIVEMHAGSEYSTSPSYDYDGFIADPNPYDDPFYDRDIDFHSGSEEEEYSPYLDIPHMWDREIRHFAIDSGADLVVVHHPHIIQGVEIYNGKLIAHSLGNFVFDLSYAETFPSMVLQSKIDETGFYEFTLDPVIIDDFIPVPAEGELGLHILDDIAMKSKALSTTLHIDRQSVQAHVMMDTLLMPQTTVYNRRTVSLFETDSLWVSSPVKLNRNGFISSVLMDSNLSSMEYRVGRERVWMGNMEEEGFTLWNINSDWEFFDDSVTFRGERSIGQVRDSGMGDNVVTNLEKRLLVSEDKDYSVHGLIKTENGAGVTMEVRCYSGRTGGNILTTESLAPVEGDSDWTFNHRDFSPPEDTKFVDFRLSSDVPDEGTAYSWFDDAGLIEWSDWMSVSEINIDAPNDHSFIQFKNYESLLGLTVRYIETVFDVLPVPTPDFTANVTNGDFPLTVQFTEISSGVITFRDWDFGDGTTSNEVDPTYEYTLPGLYSVSLTVPDYDGNDITLTRENYIQVSDTSLVLVDYNDDWNLVGLPSIVLDENVETVFPEAIEGTLFWFNESYFLDSLLETGTGYWLRFETGGDQSIQGTPLDSMTLQLTEGWNLFSGIGSALSIETIIDPENILVPNTFFGFNFGYFDTEYMEPGKGYWVRTFDEGSISLLEQGNRARQEEGSNDFKYSGLIETGNLKLYFGVHPQKDIELLSCSMPPIPPAGAFDIRFENNLRCAEDSAVIHIQNMQLPIQFYYELEPGEHWLLKFENGKKLDLIQNGTLIIENIVESLQLLKFSNVPESFHLYPNFPNPFNNRTVIKYDLPNSERVHLSVFDIRGKMITTLINRELPAGFHRFEWMGLNKHGTPVASGIYFVLFESSTFSQSQKMLLLK